MCTHKNISDPVDHESEIVLLSHLEMGKDITKEILYGSLIKTK